MSKQYFITPYIHASLNILLTVAFLILCAKASAQQQEEKQRQPPSTSTLVTRPAYERSIQGVVKSSTGRPIPGATVRIVLGSDTLATATTAHGTFSFNRVRSAEFVLLIRAMGFESFVRRYLMNDTRDVLHIPEIRLEHYTETLEEVAVGRRAGPVVKGDTTEYWAEDYIVRDFARLRDLLERMEGIVINESGSVFHRGTLVAKALFNNVEYFSGSVKDAINELPAHIVQRIQIIERPIDPENRTLSRPDTISKVLNVVTKRGASAGQMMKLLGEAGEGERYRIGASYRRIDGAEQTSVTASRSVLPSGIRFGRIPGSIGTIFESIGAPLDIPMASGGTFGSTRASIQHNVSMRTKTLRPIYSLNDEDYRLHEESISESYFAEGTLFTNRTARSTQQGLQQKLNLTLMLKEQAEMAGNVGKSSMMLTLKPKKYRLDNVVADFAHDQNYQERSVWEEREGLVHSLEFQGLSGKTQQLLAELRMSGQYALFNKKIGSALNAKTIFRSRNQFEQTAVFAHEQELPDWWGYSRPDDEEIHLSEQYLAQERQSQFREHQLTWSNRASFSTDVRKRSSLSIDFKYTSTENQEQVTSIEGAIPPTQDSQYDVFLIMQVMQVPMTYEIKRSIGKRFGIQAKFMALNEWRQGKWKSDQRGGVRYDIGLQPHVDFHYSPKGQALKYGTIGLSVYGQQRAPDFKHLNPDTVFITPFQIQVGNPDLRSVQQVGAKLSYGIFNPFEDIEMNVSSSGLWRPVSTGMNRQSVLDTETQVLTEILQPVNTKGGYEFNQQVNLAKSLSHKKSKISAQASVTNRSQPYLANGKEEKSSSITQSYVLEYTYSTAAWIRVSPRISYNASDHWNTLALHAQGKTFQRRLFVSSTLRILLPQYLTLNMDASQTVLRMTSIRTPQNPFVLNMNVERRFLRDKSLVVSAVLMDAARQNQLSSASFTEFGYNQSISNPNSRFVLLQLSWQPEIWKASRFDKGQLRQGDGSLLIP